MSKTTNRPSHRVYAVTKFGERSNWRLQALVSAAENGEPVVTIMFPHEA